jgi:hypothetical protein
MNNQDDAFKNGATPWRLHRPIRSPDQWFPRCSMWGQAIRAMATPPRRKTAPVGVAVTSKSKDFSRPNADPEIQNNVDRPGKWPHHRREACRRCPRSRGRRQPPPTKTTTGDWKVGSSPPPLGRLPAPPRCPAANKVRRHRAWPGHWHRQGA